VIKLFKEKGLTGKAKDIKKYPEDTRYEFTACKKLKCNVSREELFEIERKILENNSLYKFRCEQYKNYCFNGDLFECDYPKLCEEFRTTSHLSFYEWFFDFVMNGGLDNEKT